LLALVARLANLCAAGDPAPWLEQLRGAMAELPPRLWSRVELDVATWDALCGTVLRQMEADDPGDPDAVLTADDEARADVVMYALAAGLAVYNPPAADA
ncbi:MAG: hypothetical protein KJ018_11565, partial [Burkholderiales bacterium]|nr:hypothetical protein [Burkholderiales bacterium]